MNTIQHKYYSQNGEDFLLWQLFSGRRNGFYVDVGAFDGVHLSNSYSFEQAGWSGICIEPNPRYFRFCKESRPGATCVNVACVADDSTQEVRFFSEELGLLSGAAGNIDVEDVRKRYERRGLKFDGGKVITLPALTLNSILKEHLPEDIPIDFVSIDVEGAELDVLRGFDLALCQPMVVIVESHAPKSDDEIDRYMTAQGYFMARKVGENLFFCRDKETSRRVRHVRIKCRIEKTEHPLGRRHTLASHVNGISIHEPGILYRAMRWIWRRSGKSMIDKFRSHGN